MFRSPWNPAPQFINQPLYSLFFSEDLTKEAQYQEAAEKSMQLETKVFLDVLT